MKLIPIYKAEADVSGLAEKIRANSSISYCVPAKRSEHSVDMEKAAARLSTKASLKVRAEDLYPTESILASTVWNRNDDIFSVIDSWAARYTPVNKPTNIGHVESELVGHMTDTWVIDASGNVIPDNTVVDELPDLFHICNSAVIYTHWQDDALKARTNELIEQIEAGTKYVSMECFFSNFDYGVKSSSGEFHVIKREKSTAFLTKYLRAYEGEGVYDGYTIGRVMRNFVFSGKGYVDMPANPASIIFTDAATLNFSQASEENPFSKGAGVSLYYKDNQSTCASKIIETEKTIMSDELNLIKSELADVKAALKTSQAEKADLAEKLAKADVAKYETQISELKTQLEASKKVSDDAKAAADKAKSDAETVTAKLNEVETAKAELATKLAKVEADSARAARITVLVDGGIEKVEAEKKVDLFANLNDEQFKVVASELVAAAKNMKKDDKKEEKKDKKDDTAKAEEALENAKADEVVAPVVPTETETQQAETTRKAIASLFSKKFNKAE